MVTPAEFASSSHEDITDFQEFFSSIGGGIADGLEKLATKKSHKIKLAWHRKGKDQEERYITLRFTPEIQEKWLKVVDEFSNTQTKAIPELKKRASGEFAAAFKDGNVVIEVKEKKLGKRTKRTAFASKRIAEKIREGKFVLSRKDGKGKTIDYDAIKVLEHTDFQKIAETFIVNMQPSQEPVAEETAESTEATSEEHTEQAQATPQQAEVDKKKVLKRATDAELDNPEARKKSPQAKEAELLKEQEKALEAERDMLHKKKTNEQKDLKEEKIQTAEERNLTESKQETVKEEVGTIAAEHAIEASELKQSEPVKEAVKKEEVHAEAMPADVNQAENTPAVEPTEDEGQGPLVPS